MVKDETVHMRSVFERLSRAVHTVDKSGVIYIENPKVACSNIKWSLLNEFRPQAFAEVQRIHNRNETPFLRGFADVVSALKGPGSTIFSVVRHPRSRFVSAYFDKMHEGRDQSVWRLISRHIGLEDDLVYEPKAILERLLKSSAQDMDPHVARQTTNLFWGVIPYTDVFQLENMGSGDRTLNFSNARIVFVDQQRHSTASRRDVTMFDDEAFQMIDELYSEDYSAFGYEQGEAAPKHAVPLPEVDPFFVDFLASDRPLLFLREYFERFPRRLDYLELGAVIDVFHKNNLWPRASHFLLDWIVVRNAILQQDNMKRFVSSFTEFPKS